MWRIGGFMKKVFIWLVCLMVFMPFGADLAVLIGYEHEQENWWKHFILSTVALACVVTDGFCVEHKDT
tara:strand:- start:2925 stop:3128 length:204 start_codon:yes stop_codon:yes gene_type:complete